MADVTVNMECDASHGAIAAKKKPYHTSAKVTFTNQEQFAIAAVLFVSGVVGAIVLVLYLMMQEGVFW